MFQDCQKYLPTPPTPLSCCVMTAYQVYVDVKYGSDATGSLESPARPFRSIQAAVDAIVLARGLNVTEPWIINISVGQFPSLQLVNVDAITFQGSGENTVIGGVTLLNSGRLSPIVARQVKFARPSNLLMQANSPLLNARLSVFQVFDSVLESDQSGSSIAIASASELNVIRSDIRGSLLPDIPLIDLVEESSAVSFNDNHFEVVVESVESTQPISIYRNASTDPNTSLLSVGNQFNVIGVATSQLLSFSTTENSNGIIIGSNDTFRIIDQPEFVQRLRNNHRRLQKVLFKGNLQQATLSRQVALSNSVDTVPLRKAGTVGSYAIAEHLGEGKVVVSNNRVAGEIEIATSNNSGTGTLLLQNTAYGDNAVPVATVTAAVDNGTDRGGSLWYSGAFSINAFRLDSITPYTVTPNGNDYAIYATVDNATVILPPLTARKGRIIEIVLSLKANNILADFCTIQAADGDLIYSQINPPLPSIVLSGTTPFSITRLRLQSTQSGTGNIWFNLL